MHERYDLNGKRHENTSASESGVRDAASAVESAWLLKAQIIQQAAISMVFQSQINARSVLELLRA